MSQHHREKWDTQTAALWRKRIAAILPAPCVDCHRPVYPDQKWSVGHIIPVSDPQSTNTADNLGPSHVACNSKAGGKLGAKVVNTKRRATSHEEKRIREW